MLLLYNELRASLYIGSVGHRDTRTLGHWDIGFGTQGHWDTGTLGLGHKDTRTLGLGHKDIGVGTQGHWDTRTLGHKDTGRRRLMTMFEKD